MKEYDWYLHLYCCYGLHTQKPYFAKMEVCFEAAREWYRLGYG